MFLTGASVTLIAAAAATTLFASSAQAATCETPSVRREWRTFSTEEKTAWIAAVNCLSNLSHDDALTPSVDPSISNIVPVNTSGSYYDGSCMSLWCSSSYTDATTYHFLHRFRVYAHG